MEKTIPITERYQHFLSEMKESFWGDVHGRSGSYSKGRLSRIRLKLKFHPSSRDTKVRKHRLQWPDHS